MGWTLKKILDGARKHDASDIHLVRGVAPVLRVDGQIQISNGKPLDEKTLRALVEELLPPQHREAFEERWQLCFSQHWDGVGRCRMTLYYHAGCPDGFGAVWSVRGAWGDSGHFVARGHEIGRAHV